MKYKEHMESFIKGDIPTDLDEIKDDDKAVVAWVTMSLQSFKDDNETVLNTLYSNEEKDLPQSFNAAKVGVYLHQLNILIQDQKHGGNTFSPILDMMKNELPPFMQSKKRKNRNNIIAGLSQEINTFLNELEKQKTNWTRSSQA